MDKMRIKEIQEAVGGIFLNTTKNINIHKISTDSREINQATLFVPIIGEKFDGHKFMIDAYNLGCRNFLIDKNHEFKKNDVNLIMVDDTLKAYGLIAKYYKEKYPIPFIAVTGSVGKTSTKDIIYSVLKEKYKTLKNEGNLNNEIGLPKTLFNLDSSYRVAVTEMGMSYSGDIKKFCDIVNPNIGVITNIGMSHIENFNTQDDIFKAKMEITSFFNENSLLIINGDDPYLKTLLNKEHKYQILSYGFSKGNDIYCSNYTIFNDHIDFTCIINYIEEYFTIPSIAKHNIYNAMAAILVGRNLNIGLPLVKKGLSNFVLTQGRQTIIKKKNITIIDDSYNASSSSVLSALDVLNTFKQRRVAILGDVLETGSFNETIHKEIGKYIFGKVDFLIGVGPSSKIIIDEAIQNYFPREKIRHYVDYKELLKDIKNLLDIDDVILVKASHGMELSKVVKYLDEHYE